MTESDPNHSELGFSSSLEALHEAITMAHAYSEKEGFHLHQIVGHDGEEVSYEITRINGNTAQITIPKSAETEDVVSVTKEVPLEELYDAETFVSLRENNRKTISL